ncbi:cell division protein SepF [Spiroplasma sp. DGKH1]|uniref:cell division protein SepF n=1 Tax=Spiroplasma sp. DGKH1 TaxID=3050074 RepID=UPI0034C5C46D
MGIFKKKRSTVVDQPANRIDFSENPQRDNNDLDYEKTNDNIETSNLNRVDFENIDQLSKADLANGSNDELQNIVILPESFHDGAQLADQLIKNRHLQVKLTELSKEERIRLLDFLSGVMYALNGKVSKLANKTYEFVLQG